LEDRLVLLPYLQRHAREAQDLAHRAADMQPVQAHRIADDRIAAKFVDERVKVEIGLKHCLGVAHLDELQSARDDDPPAPDGRSVQLWGGKLDREWLDSRAELVDRLE